LAHASSGKRISTPTIEKLLLVTPLLSLSLLSSSRDEERREGA